MANKKEDTKSLGIPKISNYPKLLKESLDKFKYEVANEIGVNLKQGYNGDLTSKQAGSVGGEMVKKLVAKAANDMQQGQ